MESSCWLTWSPVSGRPETTRDSSEKKKQDGGQRETMATEQGMKGRNREWSVVPSTIHICIPSPFLCRSFQSSQGHAVPPPNLTVVLASPFCTPPPPSPPPPPPPCLYSRFLTNPTSYITSSHRRSTTPLSSLLYNNPPSPFTMSQSFLNCGY